MVDTGHQTKCCTSFHFLLFSVCLHSYTGARGCQTNAENTQTGCVPVARCGGRARRRLPVVRRALEPPEDSGRDEEPAQ